MQPDLAALNAAVQKSTAAKAVKAWIDAATPLIQPTPPPPSKLRKGLWDGNGFADITLQSQLGFGALFTGDYALIPTMQRLGLTACMQSGVWQNETGQYNVDAATAIQWAKPFHDAGVLGQLYLADEPNGNKWPDAPTLIAERRAAFKAAYPDVETTIGFWDGGDGSNIAPFVKCCDTGILDIYPVNGSGTYDDAAIPSVAASAAKLKLPFYGNAQIFQSVSAGSGPSWKLPTVDQLNRIYDQWEATPQIGMFAYCWGNSDGNTPPANQVQNHPDLLAVIKARLATLTVHK